MSENLTRDEALYRSSSIHTTRYDVSLDLSKAMLPGDTFGVESSIECEVFSQVTTFVDFIGHDVSELVIDGIAHIVDYDGARISLPILYPGFHTIKICGTGYYSHTGEGLHRFTDPQDHATYLYTQFEPADSRRMFPNFEQPDMKAEFAFTVTGPAHWVYISNAHIVSHTDLSDDVARVEFAPTRRQSTYLTALVAGPYRKISRTADVNGSPMELGFYCRETLARYFDIDDIAEVTIQGLKGMPQLFDYPYPWDKYDSVFVPEYNLGAMENPGCVTFNENAYIHRGRTTRSQREQRANTILHEMSHMWFGDLVTPKWWDDLWLKESFAEFMGSWACVNYTQYKESWENFAGKRIAWAFENDQYPTTHPITADVADIEAADQVFDGITYAKGAAVLRQLVAWVGEDAFFEGARRYFKKFQFGNATLYDLLEMLTQSSGKDVYSWAESWLQTSGVSTVTIERGSAGITVKESGNDPQTNTAIRRPHKLSLGVFHDDAAYRELHEISHYEFELDGSAFVPWKSLGVSNEDSDVIVVNDGALTYAKVCFDDRSLHNVVIKELDKPLAKVVASTALYQLLRDGLIPVHDYIDFSTLNPYTDQLGVLSQKISGIDDAIHIFTPVSVRAEREQHVFDRILDIISNAESETDQRYLWLQALPLFSAYAQAAPAVIGNILNSDSGLDQETRWKFITALSARGTLTADDIDREYTQSAGSALDFNKAMQAKASIPGTRTDTLHEILYNQHQSNDNLQALINGFMHPSGASEARGALPNYFDHIDSIWQSRSQEIAERIVYGLYPMSDVEVANDAMRSDHPEQNNPDIQAATQWLSEPNHPAALRKAILDCRDEHSRMLRVQAHEMKR